MARRGCDITTAQTALVQAAMLADAARAARVPVVFVRLLTPRGDDAGLCVEGTHGADFCGPLPQPGEAIVSKTRYSAFARTGLADQLHTQGIDTLVLAGLTTECCVASSAWDAFERDFHVLIAADACAAYEEDLHHGALKALALSGATVAQTEQLVADWNNI
jgi:nicotinamidase-related amidase